MEIISIVLIVVLGHIALGLLLWHRVRKLYAYPGLLGIPVIGNLYYFYRTLCIFTAQSLLLYLDNVAKEYGKGGLCFHYIFGFKKVALVTSPDLIKQLGYHPKLKDKSSYGYKCFATYMIGPFSWPPSDESWKAMRKEYNSHLKKQRVETNYFDAFLESADKLVELMQASRYSLDINRTAISIVQSTSLKTLIGVDDSLAFNPETIDILDLSRFLASIAIGNPLASRILAYILTPLDTVLYRKLAAVRGKIFREIYINMKEYEQCPVSEGKESYHPLSTAIANRVKNNESEDLFLWRLTHEITEVYLTSTHTISATLVGAITFLAVLPHIQERAWKEQCDIFGDDKREPTPQDLEQMKFLERFINESLRFCGPPFVEKVTSGDIQIDGIIIPKDTIVIYMLNYMRKDPKYWKDPEVFHPDRFLETNENFKYSFAPFGIGIRSCPGFTFAMTLMKILLSKILRKTKISPVDENIKFKDVEFEAMLLVDVKKPPLICVKERD